ncbi:hypothetical protein GCM10007877_39700 [Marinibactrum halimedae]|uniref:TRAP transporter small permease protein n=2 Tax=Marinibactrum halimedae TaxID=1444977 RepID=A0AA37WQL2_9GAMM|nr:hypothetical protein GCM10007877_39700 [Marinibactrum halimedae]
MMLITAIVVVLRYGFDLGSIALQESVTYLHASVFLLGMAYTLKHNEHVRVDIFYQHFSQQQRAWIDATGTLVLLLPLCALIFFLSFPFAARSWAIGEISSEPGGIPAIFLLKSLLPVSAALLALQAISETLRQALTLTLPSDSSLSGKSSH